MKLSKLIKILTKIQSETADLNCTIMRECSSSEIRNWHQRLVNGEPYGVQLHDTVVDVAISDRNNIVLIGREVKELK